MKTNLAKPRVATLRRPETDEVENDGSRIKSVALTITLLNEIAAAGGPIRVTDLARRVGETKGRIHRHLLTLRDAGILVQTGGDERYRLGWRLFELGQAAVKQFDISEIAGPALHKLRDETQLSVFLGLRDGDHMIVSHSLDSPYDIAVTIRRGQRLPAHSSAMGRIMLAYSSAEEQKRILAKPLTGTSARAMTDREEVKRRLVMIRQQLYDISIGESQHGVSTIAAPILDANANMIAAAGVIGTQQQIGETVHPKLLDALIRCVTSINATLSAHEPPATSAQNAKSASVKRTMLPVKP